MRRILFFVVFIIAALIGVNMYLIGTARADELSRYLQNESTTAQWAYYIYQNQSGRHPITPVTALRIAKAVVIASSNYDIAPDVIIGLMKTESGFDPRARSRSGALGLMQVVPYWHRKTIAGRNLYDIEAAVDIGVAILAHYQKRSMGSLAGALRRYCGYRPKAAGIYVAKVMREHRRAFHSLMLASAQPRATSTVNPDMQRTPLSLPASPVFNSPLEAQNDQLRVSSETQQKLMRLSQFNTLTALADRPSSRAPLLQAKVYLQDPVADLSISPVHTAKKVPYKNFLDFGDLLQMRWS